MAVMIDRWYDPEWGASQTDSLDSLNWQLALMSTLILMRVSQISLRLVHEPPKLHPHTYFFPSPPTIT